MTKRVDKTAPYFPAEWSKVDVHSLQALADGTANDLQQKHALDFIIKNLCGTYDLSYRPGGQEGDRDTAFAEGKRFVGAQIVKLINLRSTVVR
jgi:hypothetical protein